MDRNLRDRSGHRWCQALCVLLVPDDTRLKALFRDLPHELPLMPDTGDAAFEWDQLAGDVENDYVSRALAQLVEHGEPVWGHLGYPPARLLVDADRKAGHCLGYVIWADADGTGVLHAVLTWLHTFYPTDEVVPRLRRAARKVAARKEFHGRFAWTGP